MPDLFNDQFLLDEEGCPLQISGDVFRMIAGLQVLVSSGPDENILLERQNAAWQDDPESRVQWSSAGVPTETPAWIDIDRVCD